MSRIWKEPLDPSKHRDFMTGYQDAGGFLVESPRDNLLSAWVYFVRVASFTFQFQSVAQIEEARAYFAKTVHPARREAGHELEHYWQRWFERLPPGLHGGTKRTRVLKALDAAIEEFKRPNKAPEPMRTAVTPRAGARVAPSARMAHL